MSYSLRPHDCMQHARLSCPSLFPGVCWDSCPLSQWCYLTILSSANLSSSCPQFFPASGSFPMIWLFTSGGKYWSFLTLLRTLVQCAIEVVIMFFSFFPFNIVNYMYLGMLNWSYLPVINFIGHYFLLEFIVSIYLQVFVILLLTKGLPFYILLVMILNYFYLWLFFGIYVQERWVFSL